MNASRFLLRFTSLYIALTVIFVCSGSLLLKHDIDKDVLLIANSLIYLMTIVVFMLQQKALADKNPNVFIRSVIGGMMVRMLICVLAIIAYRLSYPDSFNMPAVFVSMFLYLVYLAVEVAAIMKLNKDKDG